MSFTIVLAQHGAMFSATQETAECPLSQWIHYDLNANGVTQIWPDDELKELERVNPRYRFLRYRQQPVSIHPLAEPHDLVNL